MAWQGGGTDSGLAGRGYGQWPGREGVRPVAWQGGGKDGGLAGRGYGQWPGREGVRLVAWQQDGSNSGRVRMTERTDSSTVIYNITE